MAEFYAKSISQACAELQTTEQGLSAAEASARLQKTGKNALPDTGSAFSKVHVLFRQFASPLMIILVVAGAISGLLGEIVDASVIFATVLINAVVGFVQEFKANDALKKLQTLVTYTATVQRDGETHEIPSTQIVPGDILIIAAGDKVQADGRIIDCTELSVDESSLTGESVPRNKSTETLSKNTSLGDQDNMVFQGTTVTDGRAHILVTATGTHTEIGKIAQLVDETIEEATPLQQALSAMGKKIGLLVLLIALFIFTIGVLRDTNNEGPLHMFETAVAVAVAAIPEGLVVTLTIILAIGMRNILKRKALVRKLLAAETLGSVSVICTDKTGTITEGVMRVTHVFADETETDLQNMKKTSIHARTIEIGALAGDAYLNEEKGKYVAVGDTTERALVCAAADLSVYRKNTEEDRVAEIPFTSERKYMAVLVNEGSGKKSSLSMYVKGAPEVLLDTCTHSLSGKKKVKLTDKRREALKAYVEKQASRGLRTLAVCEKSIEKNDIDDTDINELTFIGVVCIADPVRSQVKETLQIAKKAGIRTVMITGDHALTAQAIAHDVGIVQKADAAVLTGLEIEKLSDAELELALKKTSVFARVNPVHKIRIVEAFQRQHHVVAMTGDGVNDAPALKAADIGVAVGSGSDVAKEAADMVLLDDGYHVIVHAVEEGRTIYQNIKKVTLYLFAGSFAEVVLITGSILVGMPVAALPAQILWINIIEDAFPNIALAFDKGDKENMLEPPRRKNAPIIDTEMKAIIVAKTIIANTVLFGLFVYFYTTTQDIDLARTIVFVGFGIDAFFYIFGIRNLRKMVWEYSFTDNKYLLGAVLFGASMMLLAIYTPALQDILRTVPLNAGHWLIMLGFGLMNLLVIEAVKVYFLSKRKPTYA